MRLVVWVIGIWVVVLVLVCYVIVVIDVEWCCGISILWLLNVVIDCMIVLRLCGLERLFKVISSVGGWLRVVVSRLLGWV